MKKLLILLICLSLVTPCFADAPPEFSPTTEGEGLRVLIIDDFNGWYDHHGAKTSWVVYESLPMAEITTLDLYDAINFEIENDYDLIMCFPWFENEKSVEEMLPESILKAHSIMLAPSGNEMPTYDHNNASDKWFITVGAKDHPEWQQGEMQWEEAEMGGTCGATAMFGVQILKMMILHGEEVE